MSLRDRLKSRFLSLQDDIAAGVKNLSLQPSGSAPGSPSASPSSSYRPIRVNGEAGDDLLSFYQDQWEELHRANERNARLAAKCDSLVSSVHDRLEREFGDVTTLQMLVAQIPRVNEQIKQIMQQLGALESSFGDVEVALLALEDTIDARELQENQLEQRFQMAMYQERRKAEFMDLSNRLSTNYAKKKQESERRAALMSREKQMEFRKQFEEDMANYAKTGQLTVPKRHDPDASLETVDLNEDDDDLGGDDKQTLEAFLADDIPSVSPLPKDDEDQACGNAVEVTEDELLSVPAEGVSRAESMYYTPSDTLENLSETVAKQT